MKRKMVRVTWVDSINGSGWCKSEVYEKQKASACYTAGFMLKRSKKAITVIQSLDPDNDNGCAAITIPMCSVLKVEELEVKR